MIVPGLPGEPPAPQPIAFAATRATFDAETNQLKLNENTDISKPPTVSVVLTPDDVYGISLENAGEPAVGAELVIEPLTLTAPVAQEENITFGDAVFELRGAGGKLASGKFTKVRVDPDLMAIFADVVFDAQGGFVASPFASSWQSELGPVMLLGRLGTLDLLEKSESFALSAQSRTDFIALTHAVPQSPEPEPFRIVDVRKVQSDGSRLSLVLMWNSNPGERYGIETSPDGSVWSSDPSHQSFIAEGALHEAELSFDFSDNPHLLIRVVTRP